MARPVGVDPTTRQPAAMAAAIGFEGPVSRAIIIPQAGTGGASPPRSAAVLRNHPVFASFLKRARSSVPTAPQPFSPAATAGRNFS